MSAVLPENTKRLSGDGRNAFLVFVGIVWLAIVSGFGLDSFVHISRHGLDYPLIVHVHALIFVGWLILFTAQVALIRSRQLDLHKKLGVAGAALAVVMVVLGPATALIVANAKFAAGGVTPEFLSVELINIFAFAVFTSAALLMRRTPAIHKRLMLLGLIYLSTPGFARALNGPLAYGLGLAIPLGDPFWRQFAGIFVGPDLLMLGLGVYDLVTARRVYPAYLAGFLFALACQVTGLSLLHSPAWKEFSLKLIGQ